MPKKITDKEWTTCLETLCFTENNGKRANGTRIHERADCAEGTELFERWLNRQEVDRLLRVLSKLES